MLYKKITPKQAQGLLVKPLVFRKFPSFIVGVASVFLVGLNACQTLAPKSELAVYTPAYFDSVLTVYLPSAQVVEANKGFFQQEKIKTDLEKVYQTKQLKWQTPERKGHSAFIQQVIKACESAEMHGFSAQDYPIQNLEKLYNSLYAQPQQTAANEPVSTTPIETVMEQKIALDVLTTQTALALMHDVYLGRMPLPSKWDYRAKQKDLSALLLADSTATNLDFQKVLTSLAPSHPGYYELAGELQKYLDLKKNGGLPTVPATGYSTGGKSAAVTALAQRLSISEDLEEPYEGDAIFDDKMTQAIKQFQENNGLPANAQVDSKTLAALNRPIDDIIDLIRLNLERYRWLPEDMTNGKSGNYIFVNIPEYRMRCYRKGEIEFESITVVGETITPTPVFEDELEYMVFSPIWVIPASIAKEEIFQYAIINPAVLIAGDTEVYYKGSKVDPFSVDWKQASNEKRNYSFRQKPTDQNSMGDVKFKFPNDHGVYLHDTPAKQDFRLDYRAKSSGCVRVGKPAELAQYLLKDNKEAWSLERIQTSMKSGRERNVNMDTHVKVHLYYLTAWVNANGQLCTAADVYKHDKKQLPALKEVY